MKGMGKTQLTQFAHQQQYGMQEWQMGLQISQLGMQKAFTYGGSFANPITGQQQSVIGSRAIEDAMLNMQIRQQEFGFGQQEKQAQMSYARQETEFRIGDYQREKRFQWQMEDWTRSETGAQLQFGWSMEDYDENLRFARGRDRRIMLRNRDRAVVSENLRREGSEASRDRIQEQKGWEDERVELNKRYFEEDKQMQQERMQFDRQMFQERLEWQMREREMTRLQQDISMQINEATLMRQQQQMIIAEQIWQREFQISQETMRRQADMQVFFGQVLPEMLNNMAQSANNAFGSMVANFNAQLGAVSNSQQAMVNEMQNQMNSAINGMNATINANTVNYNNSLAKAYSNVAANYNTQLQNAIRDSQTVASQPATLGRVSFQKYGGGEVGDRNLFAWEKPTTSQLLGFESGGFTGHGLKSEPAGIVHRGEFVVPHDGALVLRGSDPEMLKRLDKMIELLDRIANKPVSQQTFNAITQAEDPYGKMLLDNAYRGYQ
ncbi:MAG: hypothetical protein HC892_00225 [Saprospiraceae bacterium]|nr:hypothetical protein [Saprospiraceae bacterium]